MGDQLKNHISAQNGIASFYEDSKIFITGATGFVGKALLEKLLRSCPRIDSIFILLRAKRGVPVEQRSKDLLKHSVFNKIREENVENFEKVKVIPGDVGLPNLGLSEEDRNFLINNIDVVFHSAATVRFDEDLKTSVTCNTVGTKRILEICKEMKKLKSCVYVSTAFSNSDKEFVEEKVYVPKYDVDFIINLVENLPEDILLSVTPKLMEKHPNTYTFAKSLAEQLVLKHSKDIPLAIVRPSIIVAAWKEPYPGWVDKISGITGILMECGRGTIKSIICDENCRMDMVPVDIVVNTLIASAWYTAIHKSQELRVYNCTSGTLNPVTWKEFGEITHKQSYKWPSKYVTWYPSFSYTTNKTLHSFYINIYHSFPALFLDVLMYCRGRKVMLLKLAKKINQALEAGSFFSTHQWTFESSSFVELTKAVNAAQDGELFQIDIKRFEWEEYVGDFLKGVRQYILKDDMSSLDEAKKKLNRLYWLRRLLQVVPYVIGVELLRHTLNSYSSV